ncbi:hypothetical protein [Enterococcus gilvus]|uniref:hypothetical protein n=1 Tax=Enterococcus gilvus TaxID=160453 RepID=UPI001C8BC4C5|nr:hypothetical protein [Enterococcus gilvus]MBX8935480.1 hypothetical protein [Enterococcus gilvus]
MSLTALFLAFGGGIFGTLFSGTIAFIFTGFLSIIGLTIALSTGDSQFMDNVVFGNFFGPQVSFVGGVAAAAWYGKIERNPEIGRNVSTPLYATQSMSTYLIGGLFGCFGYLLTALFLLFTPPIDAIALTIILLNCLIRLTISSSSVITKYSGTQKWSEDLVKDLLYHVPWVFFMNLGIAELCLSLNSATVGWGISALTLLFQFGSTAVIPVTHHITMITGYAVLATGNIWVAALIGVLAMIVGRIFERLTNHQGATHIDMPAAMIALFSLPIFLYQQ